jgi:hypothetical protein
VGAAFGRLVPNPQALGLDFLLPIYFLGMVMGFRKRPLWLPIVLASGVASILAYKFVGSPWHVSLGAVAGIADRRHLRSGTEARVEAGGADAMSTTVWIILAGAVATYLTRVGGHLVLSRFETRASARRGGPQRGAGGGADDAGRAGHAHGGPGRMDSARRRRAWSPCAAAC